MECVPVHPFKTNINVSVGSIQTIVGAKYIQFAMPRANFSPLLMLNFMLKKESHTSVINSSGQLLELHRPYTHVHNKNQGHLQIQTIDYFATKKCD